MKSSLFCFLATVLLLASCSKSGPGNATATNPNMWAAMPKTSVFRPGTTFSANPNPIKVSRPPYTGGTAFTWHAPVAKVEIHIGSPGGKLFAAGGSDGRAETGTWVTNGMTFFLQDATATDPLSRSATLAILPVAVE